MGFEGANVIFDTWVHPLMMGLEEHLLAMFRDDFEFHDGAAPSHLGGKSQPAAREPAPLPRPAPVQEPALSSPASAHMLPDAIALPVGWAGDAEKELRKIPFFVRGKARRNTERFAQRPRHFRSSPSRPCTMQKPISAADRPGFRVVIVTLDNHLAGAVERARAGR